MHNLHFWNEFKIHDQITFFQKIVSDLTESLYYPLQKYPTLEKVFVQKEFILEQYRTSLESSL